MEKHGKIISFVKPKHSF